MQAAMDAVTAATQRVNLITGKGGGTSGGAQTPQKVALAKYMEENPDATSGDISNFLGTLRAPRSAISEIISDYKKEHPSATADELTQYMADVHGIDKTVSAFAIGKQGDIARSLNVAVSHLSTFDQMVDAVNNGDMRAFNALANHLVSDIEGQPAPNNLDLAAKIVSDEIAKAVIGAGGTGGERESLQANFSKDKSPETLHSAAQSAREFMGGQLGGLRDQYKHGTKRADFNDQFLSEETKAALGVDKSAKEPKEKDKFEKGKTYKDPEGNRATYLGDGKWEQQ